MLRSVIVHFLLCCALRCKGDIHASFPCGQFTEFGCALWCAAQVLTNDFVVAGTSAENLYGTCEMFYKPDLEPDELFEVLAQALLTGVDRDALSGWGCVVKIMTPDRVIT